MESNFNDAHSRLKSIIVNGVDYLADHSEGAMKIALGSIADELDQVASQLFTAHDNYVIGSADNQSSMGDTIARLDEEAGLLRDTIERQSKEIIRLRDEQVRLANAGKPTDDVRTSLLNEIAKATVHYSIAQPNEVQIDNIIYFLNRGDWIGAIKEFRKITGTGLKESKDAIESLMATHGLKKRS